MRQQTGRSSETSLPNSGGCRGKVTAAAKVAYSAAPVFYIKGGYLIVVSSFSVISTADIEVVIDFEFFRGRQGEIEVKELSVAANNMIDSFRFKSPYSMKSHGSDENGLNWEDGLIAYHDLYTAVAGFAHLYCYAITNFKFLTELLGRPILNLQDFKCPQPTSFNHTRWCSVPCHKFPNVDCATKTAHSLYDWLIFHLQTKSYVRCPKDMSRHSSKFVSAA